MVFGPLALGGLGLVCLAIVIAFAFRRDRRTGGERPVLPSHYSTLLYADHSRYPGHCVRCGTDNEPGYRFCESCGREIPTTRDYSSRTDLRSILDE